MKFTQLNFNKTHQKGVVAVEIVYALPFLIAVFLMMIFLSDIMVVRHHLNVSMNQASRACTNHDTQGQARECIEQWMVIQLQGSSVDGRCDVRGNINVGIVDGVFLGEARCRYDGFPAIRNIFDFLGMDQNQLNQILDLVILVPFPRAL
jgi:hypothetical protein